MVLWTNFSFIELLYLFQVMGDMTSSSGSEGKTDDGEDIARLLHLWISYKHTQPSLALWKGESIYRRDLPASQRYNYRCALNKKLLKEHTLKYFPLSRGPGEPHNFFAKRQAKHYCHAAMISRIPKPSQEFFRKMSESLPLNAEHSLGYPHTVWSYGPVTEETLVFDRSAHVCGLLAFHGKNMENAKYGTWSHLKDSSHLVCIRAGNLSMEPPLELRPHFRYLKEELGIIDFEVTETSAIVMVCVMKYVEQDTKSPFAVINELPEGEELLHEHFKIECVAILDRPIRNVGCPSGVGSKLGVCAHSLDKGVPRVGVHEGKSLMQLINKQLVDGAFVYADIYNGVSSSYKYFPFVYDCLCVRVCLFDRIVILFRSVCIVCVFDVVQRQLRKYI